MPSVPLVPTDSESCLPYCFHFNCHSSVCSIFVDRPQDVFAPHTWWVRKLHVSSAERLFFYSDHLLRTSSHVFITNVRTKAWRISSALDISLVLDDSRRCQPAYARRIFMFSNRCRFENCRYTRCFGRAILYIYFHCWCEIVRQIYFFMGAKEDSCVAPDARLLGSIPSPDHESE